jgi:hypothetical protein
VAVLGRAAGNPARAWRGRRKEYWRRARQRAPGAARRTCCRRPAGQQGGDEEGGVELNGPDGADPRAEHFAARFERERDAAQGGGRPQMPDPVERDEGGEAEGHDRADDLDEGQHGQKAGRWWRRSTKPVRTVGGMNSAAVPMPSPSRTGVTIPAQINQRPSTRNSTGTCAIMVGDGDGGVRSPKRSGLRKTLSRLPA